MKKDNLFPGIENDTTPAERTKLVKETWDTLQAVQYELDNKKVDRKAKELMRRDLLKTLDALGEAALMTGEHGKLNTLYKLATGDNRVGLHILIPPELREAIKQAAKARGQTVNDMLTETLTKIFWYQEE